MRVKNIILSGLLALGVLSASAQEQQKGTTVYDFTPHWYVQVQPIGGQYTLGELGFGDLLSWNVQGAVGYNFTKVVGARFAINAWQSKAGLEIDNSHFNTANYTQEWSWKYIAPSVDVTFNLTNLFCGYNPERLFNLSAFAGVGLNIGFSNDDAAKARTNLENYFKNEDPNRDWLSTKQSMPYVWDGTKVRVFGQAGLIGDFRINDAWSIALEANANFLGDRYNSKKGNCSAPDWYFNGLVGVKYNFGKTYATRFVPAPEPEIRYVEKIVEKVVEVPATAAVEEVTVEPIRRDVFFKINSYKISTVEAQKVKDIVEYMQKYPASKVVVTGYADAGTGNDRINDRLAAQRADAVVKALKTQYGISADRITYDSKGARVQPFAENDKNRVTICIAE